MYHKHDATATWTTQLPSAGSASRCSLMIRSAEDGPRLVQ